MGVHDYRFVRRYLERQPELPLTLHQVDPLIRELVQYRDLIHQRTKRFYALIPRTVLYDNLKSAVLGRHGEEG